MGRINDLEVDQDLAFERKSWAVQRIGWALMTLVILAALAGLLGPGPLSRAKAETPDGALVAVYNRFVRASDTDDLRVSFGREAIRDGVVRLWVDRQYLGGVDVERVVPQPASVEVASDRLVYVFTAAPDAASGEVGFRVKPQALGSRRVRLGLAGGPALVFRQVVYP